MADFIFKGHVKAYKERVFEDRKQRRFDIRKYHCELLLQGHSYEYIWRVSDQVLRDIQDHSAALRKKISALDGEIAELRKRTVALS